MSAESLHRENEDYEIGTPTTTSEHSTLDTDGFAGGHYYPHGTPATDETLQDVQYTQTSVGRSLENGRNIGGEVEPGVSTERSVPDHPSAGGAGSGAGGCGWGYDSVLDCSSTDGLNTWSLEKLRELSKVRTYQPNSDRISATSVVKKCRLSTYSFDEGKHDIGEVGAHSEWLNQRCKLSLWVVACKFCFTLP